MMNPEVWVFVYEIEVIFYVTEAQKFCFSGV